MCNVSKGLKSGQKVPVINFFIVDGSGEIKCSMFDEAATKFKDVLKRHGIYEFSSGTLIEEMQRDGGFYQKENHLRRGLSIRFECYSKIIDKTDSPEGNRLPLVTYRLAGFDELKDYDLNTELDVAGIVKVMHSYYLGTTASREPHFIKAQNFLCAGGSFFEERARGGNFPGRS